MEIASKYFLNVLAQGVGRVGTFGVNLFVAVVVARLGGVDLFGQYSYILTFLSVFIVIADSGMTSVLGKHIAQVQTSKEAYWGNYLLLRVSFCLLVVILSVVSAYFLRRDLFALLVIGSLALPFLSSRFFEPIFQVYDRPWMSTYSSLVYASSYLLFSFAALKFSKTLLPLIWGYVLANILYSVAAAYSSHKLVKPVLRVDVAIIRSILRLSVPLGVSGLFVIINSRSAIFMLADMKSDDYVAMYNAAYRFVELTAMLAVMLFNPILPVLSRQASRDRETLRALTREIMELLAAIALPVAIICPFVSGPLMRSLYGDAFSGSAAALNVLAWVGVLVLYSLFTSSVALSIGVVKFGYWNTASAALLSIILNYALIPRYGFVGSAWAALICEGFLAGVTVAYITKNMKNLFKGRQWAKIIAANCLLAAMLYSPVFGSYMPVKIVLSLAVYLALLRFVVFRSTLTEVARLLPDPISSACFTTYAVQLRTTLMTLIRRRMKYLLHFFYSEQVKFRFSSKVLAKCVNDQPVLPDRYAFRFLDDSVNLEDWAALLNSDGKFGQWTPARIESDILAQLIAPDAVSLVYHDNTLVSCGCACKYSVGRHHDVGVLMWMIVDKAHRHKGLSRALLQRTLRYFAREGYPEVVATTDPFRLAALYLYLSGGAKPEYDSFYSFLQWWKIKYRLRFLRRQR
jgi:O-antigen/teichoic acid export membrane protein/GNAT superfamily N-acetyltransferase